MKKLSLFILFLSVSFCLQAQNWNFLQKVVEANVSSGFGIDVAIDGNTAVVGAQFHDNTISPGVFIGAAYVYEFDGTNWVRKSKLVPSDGFQNDRFGTSVAIDGDKIVIGSYFDELTTSLALANDNFGAVYVYHRPGANWPNSDLTETQKLLASDAAINNQFGSDVAIEGNTMVIGADAETGVFPSGTPGKAYIFELSGGTWTETAILTVVGAINNQRIGTSVDISNDVVVVGASGVFGVSGAAYIYEKPIGGWISKTEDAKLTANNLLNGSGFGFSVAIAGNTVVVGVPQDTTNAPQIGPNISKFGYVATFEKPIAGWSGTLFPDAELISSDGPIILNAPPFTFDPLDNFGTSLQIADNGQKIIVGAPQHNNPNNAVSLQGKAYVFEKPSGGWQGRFTEDHILNSTDNPTNFQSFGQSVAIQNDFALVGSALMPGGNAQFFSAPVPPSITNDDPSIDDPCSCFNPLNYMIDGQIYFHELVTITSVTGETWQLNNLISGPIFDNLGNDISGTLPINLTETAPGSGIYTIDFWHLPNQGYSAEFNRTVAPLGTPLPMANQCTDCNNIPTTSEWGLIIFALLLASAGIMVLRRQRKLLSYEV